MADTQRETPGDYATSPHHPGHGNSVAAWTAVGIIMVAALVMAVAVVAALPWLFWVGCGLVVLAVIVGKVLAAMGFGVDGKNASSGHP